MKIFRKVCYIILTVIFLNILVSSLVEMSHIYAEKHSLETTARIASELALGTFEVTQFSGFDDNLNVPLSEVVDTLDNVTYEKYIDAITSQAADEGIYRPGQEIYEIINFLKEEQAGLNDGTYQSAIAPFAFSWAYLEKNKLNEQFRAAVAQLVTSNWNPDNDFSLAFTGTDLVTVDSTSVTVDNVDIDGYWIPHFVKLSPNSYKNTPEYKTYASIFGTSDKNAMKMINNIHESNKMYNYIITYNVTFRIKWRHNTNTPYFKASFRGLIDPEYVNDRGYLCFPIDDVVIQKQYVVVN